MVIKDVQNHNLTIDSLNNLRGTFMYVDFFECVVMASV